MDRAVELLEYYADYPLANVVLSLVHLKRERRRPMRRRINESGPQGQMRELSGMLGQPATPLPAHLREMANWALAHSPRKAILN
jgi:hypothetical protein